MNINNELVLQEPINFHGIIIYQPTIREIFKYGINEYNNQLLPYLITLDMFNLTEEHKKDLKVFDLINFNQDIFLYLLTSLQILCRCQIKDIEIINNGIQNEIKIKEGILNRDNFDEFAEIVLKIHARERPKEDKLPDNPRQREIELKLRANRARVKNNNELQLCDIINIVKYGGKYRITTDEIKNMTLWELMNAYKAKLEISHYEDSFSIALVAGDKNSTLNDKHWVKQLRIDT